MISSWKPWTDNPGVVLNCRIFDAWLDASDCVDSIENFIPEVMMGTVCGADYFELPFDYERRRGQGDWPPAIIWSIIGITSFWNRLEVRF